VSKNILRRKQEIKRWCP